MTVLQGDDLFQTSLSLFLIPFPLKVTADYGQGHHLLDFVFGEGFFSKTSAFAIVSR
jgi:hypothetical protein